MADKKRKTLQIKRPDPNSVRAKKKTLPKVNMDEKAATSSVDTDELTSLGPKSESSKKSNTTRIALPDEDKIRKARRANATQDLGAEDALPSAEQIEQAQKNATMPIMIDTENVQDNSTRTLNDTDDHDEPDRTMEIDAEALSTANMTKELSDVANSGQEESDQTMEIDSEALKTGNLQEALNEANTQQDQKDQTLKIDSDDLQEASKTQALDTPDTKETNDQTMMIDPDALATGDVEPVKGEDVMSMETMQMDSSEVEEALESSEEATGDEKETDLTLEEMKESFNAQTMEMDASKLEDEMAKKNSGKLERVDEKEDRAKTMDLSNSRPKTIMIKRPSKKAPPSSNTPTVKTVRPDAPTVQTSRPVTANRGEPKQDTSRIDVPGDTPETSKEGKTIKLRRPSGAPASRSGSTVSRTAGNAGLSVNEDGTVTPIAKAPAKLGGGWLAVAVITFLISAAGIWVLSAQLSADLPMPGRLVDVNNQLIDTSL